MIRRLPGPALLAILLFLPVAANAQAGYRQPPPAIAAILDAQPTPAISLSPQRNWFVLMERRGLPSIEEVSEPHLKLAGSRINPRTNGPASTGGFDGFTLQRVGDGEQVSVRVPSGGRLSGPSWAPDGRHFAFTQTTDGGIALYLADTAGTVRSLLGPVLNGTTGSPCRWLDGGSELLCAMIPAGRGATPAPPAAPDGPVIQETRGRAAPERTYQDLLTSPHDEALFEHYFARQWVVLALDGGATPLGPSGLTVSLNPSPDGRYFLARTIERPFSYQVTWGRFPSRTAVWDRGGREVRLLRHVPQVETQSIARGAVNPGPRSWRWRSDAPATLLWTEALDNGDPAVEAEHRDRIVVLEAPFAGEPVTWLELAGRAGGIWWGRDNLALVSEDWAPTRETRTWMVDPSNLAAAPRLLWERRSDDRYGDPGSPMMQTDASGRTTLHFSRDGRSLWLTGAGAGPEGDRPFIDRLDLRTLESTRLWQSSAPYYETVVAAIDADQGRFITRRESRTEPPNYWQRDVIRRRAPVPLTRFTDPAPEFAGITSQFLSYTRADGVTLSGTMHLPRGYDRARDGALPFLFWVYPSEFQSADAASQVRGSPHRFTRPGGASHLFLLTQGYGILDNPSFPIIGEGETANDSYVEQLESSARAAIDTLVAMGVADRDRIAVGGHSYGAFTTANLLAHTRLFRAGIARSGAYNRSLTPFGFQAERRTYWEAEPVYRRMSPFTYADSIRDPLLFIHGMDDNNSGTFPIQSERMYAAVKGHGGTAKLVMLPGESHGYAARESVGHTLAEMVEWLDRHVKPPRTMTP
jgi:dipeptidyl aminopeptidase/acylaminoacyl peptidase